MRIKDLSADQYKRYFEARLQGKKFARSGSSAAYMALCPFHEDKKKSLSINIEKGAWKCHAGTNCGGGGVIDFERKFSGADEQTAIVNIADLIGEPQIKMGSGASRAEVIYPYTDEQGKLLFQVVRYPGKKFIQRKPCPCQESKSRTCDNKDCKSGWVYTDIAKARTVLYHLREVVTAREIFVCEGEKDVETLRAAIGLPKVDAYGRYIKPEDAVPIAEGVAATSCPRGAGKWLDSFAPFLSGKKVIILPDNDEKGQEHGRIVAHSIHRYAAGVKVVQLSGLEKKGDVTNFLEKKTLADLIGEINKTPLWNPPETETSLFVNFEDFVKDAPREINWLIEGVIEKGSNGMMIARPKAGKSFTVLDMAIALAAGQSWLPGPGTAGFYIPNPVRTHVVSREDNPHTSQWRGIKLADGRQAAMADLRDYLYINTRMQSNDMKVDDPDMLNALIRDLEKGRCEFLILDVFRKLHSAEENDNTEMQRVIDCVSQIQDKVGCQIAIIHHDNKREDATLTERARGASAIAGFAEWIIGLKVVNPEEAKHLWVREMEIEIKAALPPDNFYYMIKDQPAPKTGICLERVQWEPPKKTRKKADTVASTPQGAMFAEDPTEEDIPF